MLGLSSRKLKEPFYPKERFRTTSGVALEYIFFDRKQTSTLVFVNGWTLRHSSWKAQMRDREGNALFPRYNMLFLNNRGHGNVELGNSTSSSYLSDCTGDLRELLLHLNLTDVHLVAHSMGTLIAVELYTTPSSGITTHSLTFASPIVGDPLTTFPVPEPIRATLRVFNHTDREVPLVAVAKGMFSLSSVFPFPRFYHLYFRFLTGSSISFDSFRKFMESILDVHSATFVLAFKAMLLRGEEIGEKMHSIACPVLSVTGERDFLVSPHSLHVVKERIPHAVCEILPETTHFPQAERPGLFNSLLFSFLESV